MRMRLILTGYFTVMGATSLLVMLLAMSFNVGIILAILVGEVRAGSTKRFRGKGGGGGVLMDMWLIVQLVHPIDSILQRHAHQAAGHLFFATNTIHNLVDAGSFH
jgi:hypothetical protein